MSVRYLFNTAGKYVAYLSDGNIFTRDNKWFGYIDNGNEVYDTRGRFVGYVLSDDRVVRNKMEMPRLPQLPPLPPLPALPPLPPLPRLAMLPLPPPYEDVFKNN